MGWDGKKGRGDIQKGVGRVDGKLLLRRGMRKWWERMAWRRKWFKFTLMKHQLEKTTAGTTDHTSFSSIIYISLKMDKHN